MQRIIDYYYTHASPWAYIGHEAFLALADRREYAVRFRPVSLTTVFAETGGLPLAKRHPVRQAYRLVELQRWRAYRNIPLTLKPAHFPVNPELADRIALAVAVEGGPVAAYSLAVFKALWVDELDIARDSVQRAILERLGLNADATLGQASEKPIVERYMSNQAEAIETGVFGSPSYVLNGEVFWGQDRLDLLDAALAEGRVPFSAP
ncbi:2-hydroxychromene-2-carboxylate isomerase [Stappia stellulata]|uniref:2-hydroxychromene-2-carboxylate isomerase n=1 Tax=Stappia stellulata TaxID=71235 RepID=UPI00040FB59F|nr:2-hydroxychromene-2-carboxylate isomerase [Stappia stellulata]